MRLKKLTLSDFRGFAGQHSFDLEADAIILVAANGQGKTSFFDGILWGMTGLLTRLGDSPRVLSLYSKTGEARVELEIATDDDKCLRIVRRDPGGLTVELDGDRRNGERATSLLHSTLWPQADQAPDGDAALANALTRSVYLQQDLVRDFVEGDDDKERFAAVSELAGAGRVTELSVELESARRSWTRATNLLDKELLEARQRLEGHEAQLDALGSFDAAWTEETQRRWADWWPSATALEPELGKRETPNPPGSEATNALESALRLLEATRRARERRMHAGEALLEELEQRLETKATPDVFELVENADLAKTKLDYATDALQVAEKRAAERRQAQVEQRQAAEELGSLAELAIRHIEGSCPVCGQEHDQVATKAHLEGLIKAAGSNPPKDLESETSRLAGVVKEREEEVFLAQTALREAELAQSQLIAWRSERDERLRELGLEVASDQANIAALTTAVAKWHTAKEEIDACEAEGERLSVDLARGSEQTRAQKLTTTIKEERTEVDRLTQQVEARQRTGKLAGNMLDALREASTSVVEAELKRIDPLLQRIYSAADPHPCLRVVKLLSSVSHGRGRLNAALDDRVATLSVEQPEGILSSSQLNALAVSVFLALNLGLPSVPLPIAMLDDPLQSLDDVNLLGLIDLLRRTKGQRQLLLSTHDERFGALLTRKLRPVRDDGPTRIIEIDGWGRHGPSVRETEAPRDSEPLRIAVS